MRLIFGLLIIFIVTDTCNGGFGTEGNGRCTCIGYHRLLGQLPRGTFWLGHLPPGSHCPKGQVMIKIGQGPIVCLSDYHPLSKWMYGNHKSGSETWLQIKMEGPRNATVVQRSNTRP
ncbi:chemokine vCXCL1 [Human betaherpesvirus 5]|uniref:Alpha-chemokine n=1 Tax=Human cytomegalovirus TaxID=10359 RepID=Q6SWR6_HCMV|nr:UL146 [Human betaherpesvirus 5]AAX18447.1 UL146 [Human betaherpesvirus 5]ABA02104.1 UL146 [Human betaherpesvirus 5]ABA02107.1 UL146 [Human betaherpesvirus 5]ABA02110.1 UL146 [Human betaherpesvirus 5]